VIQTGVHHDGTVEVVSGLEVGQRIVARGHATLVEGQLVAPRNIDGSPIEAVSPAVAGGP